MIKYHERILYCKIAYNQRKKDREEYLKLLRKLKTVLQNDFDGAKEYIIRRASR